MGRLTTVCLLTDETVHAVVFDARRRGQGVIAHGEERFRLPDSLLVAHDPSELAHAMKQAVGKTGRSVNKVDLVLPLQWCFTHVLRGITKRATSESLAYEFEQHLPLPLEELTCAFLPLGGGSIVAAAVPTTPTAELIQAVSHHGLEVDRITADVVAMAGGTASRGMSSGTIILDSRWARVVARSDDPASATLATFGLRERGDISRVIAEQLQRRALTDGRAPERWSVLNLSGAPIGSGLDAVLRDDNGSSSQLSAVEAVEAIATAASSPSAFDLRTGNLARQGRWAPVIRLVQHCMIGLLVLLLVCSGGMRHHRRLFEEQLAGANDARRVIYTEVFETEILPPGAAMRLASERVRLEGLTQSRGGSASVQRKPTFEPLAVLREIVAGLPDDVRVMLSDVRVDGTHVTLRGQTAEHRDAERIVETMNRIPNLRAQPPRTARLQNGGVEFSISATGAGNDEHTARSGS